MCGNILEHLADLFPKTMNLNISTNVNKMLVYYQCLWDLRDKRVDDWPMMNSPWPTISLCVGYIYLSMILGKLKLSNEWLWSKYHQWIQNPNIWDSTFCQLLKIIKCFYWLSQQMQVLFLLYKLLCYSHTVIWTGFAIEWSSIKWYLL